MSSINTAWHNYNKKHLDCISNNLLYKKTEDVINKHPSLTIINNQELLNKTMKQAKIFSHGKEIFIIFGTGGSNLGSRSLINLKKSKNKFFFYDNVDPNSFDIENILQSNNIKKIGFIIISKSGTTSETLSQFSCLIEICEQKNLLDTMFKNTLVITEDSQSPLRQIAVKNNCTILNHEKDIGGRYSIFSNVGLLPALLNNFDARKFLLGADNILSGVLNETYLEHKRLSNIFYNHSQTKFINSVLMTYSDSLFFFGKWYLQLWSESIGKNSKGITPIHSIGTTDQHSQLQLYLDGPKDKFFTFITTNNKDKGITMNKKILDENELNYLSGKKMGDLMEAEQKATIETFKKNNFLFRVINLPDIDEFTIGQLMCSSIVETITTCILLKINPFDQPAVEQGKILTKKYLS